VFTRALHWSLFWARSIQSISYHPVIHFKLSTHLRLGFPSGLFPSDRLPHSFTKVSCSAYSSTLKMFLRNVGGFSTDYTALYPRRYNSSSTEKRHVKEILVLTINKHRSHEATKKMSWRILRLYPYLLVPNSVSYCTGFKRRWNNCRLRYFIIYRNRGTGISSLLIRLQNTLSIREMRPYLPEAITYWYEG
jgi:hypothetical protein